MRQQNYTEQNAGAIYATKTDGNATYETKGENLSHRKILLYPTKKITKTFCCDPEFISTTGKCYYLIPTALEPCQNVLLYRREGGTETISGPRNWSSMNSRKGHSVVYFNPPSLSVWGKGV
jgi:hypothetical protein